jgi:orotate phosphoribosyltransferase
MRDPTRVPKNITDFSGHDLNLDLLAALPARRGHFLLESGYHADLWITVDGLFVDPARVAPLIEALAARLRCHAVTAVCGPLTGGAFLAQALAGDLGVDFYHTEPHAVTSSAGLFKAEYRLPSAVRQRVRGQRVVVVDDVISAGSSVRASVAALKAAGGSAVVIGAFLVLGDEAVTHFAHSGIPIEALEYRDFVFWQPSDCPLCRAGSPLEDPR